MSRRYFVPLLATVMCLPLWAQDAAIVKTVPGTIIGEASLAVKVKRAPLAHTALILPVDADGVIRHAGNARDQAMAVLDSMAAVLDAAAIQPASIVKVNIYAANEEVVPVVDECLRERLAHRPALTYVVNALPQAGALVAMDAVAIAPEGADTVTHHRIENLPAPDRAAHLSIMPAGRIVYISGQAEPGESLQEAARNTLTSLKNTLVFLGLDTSHIVQVKSFLKPLENFADVDAALAEAFPEGLMPAAVHVEWTYGPPIEIELIAFAPEGTAPQADGRLTFLTPPGMTASPVFSRLCVVDSPEIIFVSGLYGANATDAEGEVREIFAVLGDVLQQTGGDFRHLVKATYYCSNDETSNKLNEIRPAFYDPARPPAASKSGARGVGLAGKGVAVDMIAVPAE